MAQAPESERSAAAVPVYLLPADPPGSGERLTLAHVVEIVRRRLRWIIAGGILGAVAGFGAALLMTPIYRAETIVAPRKFEGSGVTLGNLGAQLGGLAALAGVGLPGGAGGKAESLAVLNSYGFLARFVERHKLLPVLFPKRWDASRDAWDVERPSQIPTLSDGVDRMRKKVLFLKDDRRTALVTVAIEWRDRALAAQWANALVDELNAEMRTRAIADSHRRIEFLNRELDKATSVELREAISRLTESEIKTAMVANVQQEFAFEVLDEAVSPDPDKYVRPNPLLTIAAGGTLGVVGALVLAAWLTRRRARHSAGR